MYNLSLCKSLSIYFPSTLNKCSSTVSKDCKYCNIRHIVQYNLIFFLILFFHFLFLQKIVVSMENFKM